jgi:hypothetical protein
MKPGSKIITWRMEVGQQPINYLLIVTGRK